MQNSILASIQVLDNQNSIQWSKKYLKKARKKKRTRPVLIVFYMDALLKGGWVCGIIRLGQLDYLD